MVRYKYFGWVTKAEGKTVWEIVGNLKNHGVGRLLTRTQFSRYKEPSFYKIIKAEARVDRPALEPGGNNYRHTILWVETVFRGIRYSVLREISLKSWEPDWLLIPKEEEAMWIQRAKENMHVPEPPPKYYQIPPTLKIILNEERKAKGLSVIDDYKTDIIWSQSFIYKMSLSAVKEPSTKTVSGLGKPLSPRLYANIEEYKTKIGFRHVLLDRVEEEFVNAKE